MAMRAVSRRIDAPMKPPAEEDDMRRSAEWMVRSDDRILEVLRDEGNLTPSVAAHYCDLSRKWASKRLLKMAEFGLVAHVGPQSAGLYRITEDGRAYLAEDLDASTLDADSESESESESDTEPE